MINGNTLSNIAMSQHKGINTTEIETHFLQLYSYHVGTNVSEEHTAFTFTFTVTMVAACSCVECHHHCTSNWLDNLHTSNNNS
jgi:hypothetical protein